MKKKILCLVMVATFAMASFTGCGDKKSKDSEPKDTGVVEMDTEEETEYEGVTLAVCEEPQTLDFGKETGFEITIPAGFAFNDGWSCYSDKYYKTAIWVADASIIEKEDDIKFWADKDSGEKSEVNVGDYTVIVSKTEESFYGAQTKYYVNFNGKYDDVAGASILVSNNDNQLDATCTPELIDMLGTIEKK